MALHQLHPRRRRLPFQTMPFGQLNPRHVLEHNHYRCFINLAGSDLTVAMRPILQDQIIRSNRRPELKIVHGFQPGFNIIDIFELLHGSIVPSADKHLQISVGKRGKP